MKKTYPESRKKLEDRLLCDNGQIKKLPSLQTLATEFGCTAPTVMRAVQSLVNNGLLTPLRGGGYMSVPRNDSDWHIRVAAVITAGGMLFYEDSYYTLLHFHATYALTCADERNIVGINTLQLQTYDELGRKIDPQFFSGVMLVAPREPVLKKTKKICRSASLPLGIFGSSEPAGQISAYFDIHRIFPVLLKELAGRGRRRILAIARQDNSWHDAMKEAIGRSAGSFDCAEFYVDTPDRIASYVLHNTGGRGKKFDTVIFVILIPGLYGQIKAQAPECLCVMPRFAAGLVHDFHGLSMHFDVEAAGKTFGKAMYDAIWEKSSEPAHSPIPFDIREL